MLRPAEYKLSSVCLPRHFSVGLTSQRDGSMLEKAFCGTGDLSVRLRVPRFMRDIYKAAHCGRIIRNDLNTCNLYRPNEHELTRLALLS